MTGNTGSGSAVVLVDDESSVLLSSKALLSSAGIKHIETIADGRELLPFLEHNDTGVVVLDLFMPFLSGQQLLPEIVGRFADLPVVVMTASHEIDTAVACMKDGAFDYLVKPVEERRFISAVERALEWRSLRRQVNTLKHYLLTDELAHGEAFAEIITVNRKMRGLFQYAEAVANSREPVLITGETGVGKELFARAVHHLSERVGPYVPVNVAGLDDDLFSDTLFGHRQGAFTGADRAREGLVSQAAGGTLFLDEVGDLQPASQIKLLRLLQERQFYPLGSDVPRAADVRVVCATNRDLRRQAGAGQFRSDLYYRLSVHQLELPPLRERRGDIPLLLSHFLEQAATAMDKPTPEPPAELLTLLETYHFPGNVRELRAMVFDAVARHAAGPILSMESFRNTIRAERNLAAAPGDLVAGSVLGDLHGRLPTLKEAEHILISEALRRAKGNQGTAAALLGISRPALNRRLARLRSAEADTDPD